MTDNVNSQQLSVRPVSYVSAVSSKPRRSVSYSSIMRRSEIPQRHEPRLNQDVQNLKGPAQADPNVLSQFTLRDFWIVLKEATNAEMRVCLPLTRLAGH